MRLSGQLNRVMIFFVNELGCCFYREVMDMCLFSPFGSVIYRNNDVMEFKMPHRWTNRFHEINCKIFNWLQLLDWL